VGMKESDKAAADVTIEHRAPLEQAPGAGVSRRRRNSAGNKRP